MQNYHKLDVWQRGMDYAVRIYGFLRVLPDDERYNLIAQLRRAVTSVPLDIAEGAGCSTSAEFGRFLAYAYRSLKETVTCLELCRRLYPSLVAAEIEQLMDEGDQIARMTYALLQSVAGTAVVSGSPLRDV